MPISALFPMPSISDREVSAISLLVSSANSPLDVSATSTKLCFCFETELAACAYSSGTDGVCFRRRIYQTMPLRLRRIKAERPIPSPTPRPFFVDAESSEDDVVPSAVLGEVEVGLTVGVLLGTAEMLLDEGELEEF